MQITLNVDAQSLKETVDETVRAFSPDIKATIVTDVLKQCVKDQLRLSSDEVMAMATKSFRESWKGRSSWDKSIYVKGNRVEIDRATDEEVKSSKDFEDWFKTSPVTLNDNIYRRLMEEIDKAAVARVKKTIDEDPIIQSTIQKCLNNLVDKIPTMIEQALKVHFVTTMYGLLGDMKVHGERISEHGQSIQYLRDENQRG